MSDDEAPRGYSPTQRRDVTLLAVFRGASFLGDGLAMIALYLRVAVHGHAWAVAGLGLAAMVPFGVLAPVAGVVVDRVRAKPFLVTLGVVEALVSAALGRYHGLSATIALVVVLNASVALSMPGYSALLPSIAGEANIGAAQGVFQAVQGLASVAGPVLGGLLVGTTGQSVPLYLDGLSFLLGSLGTLLLRADRRPAGAHLGDTRASAGLRHIVANPILRDLSVLIFAFMLTIGVINVAEVFFVTQTLHGSALAYGLLGASFGAGMIAGSLAGGRGVVDSRVFARRAVVSVVVVGVAVTGVGAVSAVWQIYPLMVLAGAAVGIANVAATTLFTVRSPDHLRGRVFAALVAVNQVAQVAATVAGGAILSLIAPRTVYWWGGGLATGVALLVGGAMLRPGRLAEAPAD